MLPLLTMRAMRRSSVSRVGEIPSSPASRRAPSMNEAIELAMRVCRSPPARQALHIMGLPPRLSVEAQPAAAAPDEQLVPAGADAQGGAGDERRVALEV